MPFRLTKLTRAVNPIKLHEYLAAGLPVIGTSIPEAQRYAGLVALADAPEDFARACDRVQPLSVSERQAISRTVQTQTWQARVETLSEIVMNHVNGHPVSTDFDVLRPEKTSSTSSAEAIAAIG